MELFDASPLAAGISHLVDPERVFLFGFSDGATVGVELMLTRRFHGTRAVQVDSPIMLTRVESARVSTS